MTEGVPSPAGGNGIYTQRTRCCNSDGVGFPHPPPQRLLYYNNILPLSRRDFKARLITSDTVSPSLFATSSKIAFSPGCRRIGTVCDLAWPFGKKRLPGFLLVFSAIFN